jgi:hypothetical protein
MAQPARAQTRYTVEQYFGLVHQEVLRKKRCVPTIALS